MGPVLVVMALIAAACGGGDDTQGKPSDPAGVRVASFPFAESELLAELYAQVIEAAGIPVERLGPVGPREIIAPALEQGLIDLVPEYLGTALGHWGATEHDANTDSALAVLQDLLAPRGLTPLAASPAQDKNVFVVTSETAEQNSLVELSDLSPLAADLLFGGPPECAERVLCFAGLEAVYGLSFADFVVQISLAGTVEALHNQEIDVGLMFSTAAELETSDLVVLGDDRGMQPAENIVPVVRTDAIGRWGPGLTDAVDELSVRLATAELRRLNVRVAETNQGIEQVARDWLTGTGIIDAD